MSNHRYTGEDERYYPTLALSVSPGDVVTFPDGVAAPDDGRWTDAAADATPVEHAVPAVDHDEEPIGAPAAEPTSEPAPVAPEHTTETPAPAE